MRTANFDALALGELSVNFLEAPAKVVAKAAFINTRSGSTHGWTTCHQWSQDTIEKLRELRALMERDLAAIHFADGPSGLTTSSTTTGSGGLRADTAGLGEHLGTTGDNVPQG